MLQLVGIKNALGRKSKGKQSEITLKALFDINSTVLLCYAFKGRSKTRDKNAAVIGGCK